MTIGNNYELSQPLVQLVQAEDQKEVEENRPDFGHGKTFVDDDGKLRYLSRTCHRQWGPSTDSSLQSAQQEAVVPILKPAK